MSVLDNWQQWKSFLGDHVIHAKEDGMQKKAMSAAAYEIGDYLAKKVEPRNEQERVLADLWSVATEEEQHMIANLMIRLVQRPSAH